MTSYAGMAQYKLATMLSGTTLYIFYVWSWCDTAPVHTTVYIDTTTNEINSCSSDVSM